MKKLWTLGIFALASVLCMGQTTTVSGTSITDSDGTVWVNGNVTVQFYPNPATPNVASYKVCSTGASLSAAVLNQGPLSLDGAGNFSATVYDNTKICPSGSQWQFTVCPLATSKCGVATTSVSGTTQNITSQIDSAIPAPRFPATIGNYGYADVEAVLQLVPGGIYYNTPDLCYRVWNGASWGCSINNATLPLSIANQVTNPSVVFHVNSNSVYVGTPDGTTQKPFTTIGAAMAAMTQSIAYGLSCDDGLVHTENLSTGPSAPTSITLYGNQCSLTSSSALTFLQPIYDYGFGFTGTVNGANSAQPSIIEGAVFNGVINVSGALSIVQSEFVNSSTINIGAGSTLYVVQSIVNGHLIGAAGASLTLDNVQMNSGGFASNINWNSGGQLTILNGSKLIDGGVSPNVACQNGALSTSPNVIGANVTMNVGIQCGSAYTTIDASAVVPSIYSGTNTSYSSIQCTGTGSSQACSTLGSVTAGSIISNIAGPVVNLLQYAACDGATDDRVAIGSAITAAGALAASTGSAYLYVPDGRVCLINSNPNSAVSYNALETLPPGVGIKGSGTIKIGNGVNFDSLFAWTSAPTPTTFEDFTVDLNGANNPISTDPTLGTINRRAVFQAYVTGGNGLTFKNLTFKNGNGVWSIATAANNVTINGNHWLNWGLNSSVNFDASLIYSNPVFGTTVTNNDFTAGGPALRSAIEVHNNDAVIQGNRVYGFPIGIVYAANPATIGTTVARVNISGNDTYTEAGCILIAPQNGFIDNLNVVNNTCHMDRQNLSTNYVLTGEEQGIAWAFGFNYGLSNFKFDNNTVEWVTETSSQTVQAQMAGISLYNGSLSSNATLVNGEVAGNTVTNAPTACFNFFPTSETNLLVRNNLAINCTATSASLPGGNVSGGFAFQLGTGGKVSGLVVENNHAIDTRATTKLQTGFQWIGAAGDGAPTGASFTSGNTVTFAGTATADFNFYNSGPIINLNAPGGPSGGYINFVSMTSGNYTPLGATVYDPNSITLWTNASANGLAWIQNYLGSLSNGSGLVITGAQMAALTGVHGTSGTKIQFSDGTGATGTVATFASDGSVTGGADLWLPEKIVPANCNNTTAGNGMSLPTSGAPTAICRTGTYVQTGYLQFAASQSAQWQDEVPGDWDSANGPYVRVNFTQAAATASQLIIFTVAAVCSTTTDDTVWPAVQTFSTTTTGSTINTQYSQTLKLNSTTMANCAAGSMINFQISTSSGSNATTNLQMVTVTWPHKTPGVSEAN